MNDHNLLEAVGGINDKYIHNASAIKPKRSRYYYTKWIAAAACFCVIIGGIVYLNNIGLNTSKPDAGNGVDGTVIPGGIETDESDPGEVADMKSIAVFPATESVENVADATLTEIAKADLTTKNSEEPREESETIPEHLIRYLPDEIPNGFELERAMLYETTMNSGIKYYMVRATYSTPSTDGSEEDVVEGFTVFVMNYKPVVEKIYTIDSLTQTALDGGTFHISIDDVYIGFSDVDLIWEEFQIVLNSLRKESTTTENGEDRNVENESFMDAPVDESTYSEAREYSDEIVGLQNRVSAAMGPGHELYFVTVAEILENPDRLHVIVNSTDEELINTLKSYNTDGVNMEIEYSAGTAIEE